jgi:hypothetical protein
MPYNPLLGRAPTPEEEARSAQMQRLLFQPMANVPLPAPEALPSYQNVTSNYATNPQQVAAVQAARAAAPATPGRSGAMPADFEAKQRQIYKEVTGQEYKRGGAVKKSAKAKPAAKASNFRRGDGLAQRGKTKGRIV